MAVHNEERFAAKALRSVLDQSLQDFEVILVDDASTDGTLGVVSEFARADHRIKTLRNATKHGLTRSLNMALVHAVAPLIARLDGDDITLSDRLARQVDYLSSNDDVVLVGMGVDLINDAGETLQSFPDGLEREVFRWTSFAHSPLIHSTAMFRAGAARRFGGYDNSFMVAQDYQLWSRLLSAGEGVLLAGVGTRHRVHDRSISARRLDKQVRSIIGIATANVRGESRLLNGESDLVLYREFLAAMHGLKALDADIDAVNGMLNGMIERFATKYRCDVRRRAEIRTVTDTWLTAVSGAKADQEPRLARP